MTKEREAEIRNGLVEGHAGRFWIDVTVDLLAELDRLRAALQRVEQAKSYHSVCELTDWAREALEQK